MRTAIIRLISLALIFAPAWVAHAPGSDYAAEVMAYDSSASGTWNNPATVLGPPTVDTGGDFSMFEDRVAVVPVFAPWLPSEIYRVGTGTSLTVKFDHRVLDDPLNPCGVDFIIFGNATQQIGGGITWTNGDPNLVVVQTDQVLAEPGVVSVSQDDVTWYTFSDGPYADSFAPTLGRIYDPDHPEPSLENNSWWGEPTIPTYPLNPQLKPSDFVGHSVARIAKRYGYSAGGTGFDLGQLTCDPPLGWIQYVKIEHRPPSPEIDALADVAAFAFPDFDGDSDVDEDDLARFQACVTGPAMGPPNPPPCRRADFDQDGDVDQSDFGLLQRCIRGPQVLFDWHCMDE